MQLQARSSKLQARKAASSKVLDIPWADTTSALGRASHYME